mmetsp:Transcript_73815/g.229635  ORF Transcript_73815/g.229635 Transcript_73815/m.229635 type:complete len:205 (-) Transcript_73815:464-1078(-)
MQRQQLAHALDGLLIGRPLRPAQAAILAEEDARREVPVAEGLLHHPPRDLGPERALHHREVLHVLVHAEGALAEVEHGDDAARAPEVEGLVPGQAQHALGRAELARAHAAAVALVGEDGAAEVDDDDPAAAGPPRLRARHPGVRREAEGALAQHDVAALQVRVRHTDGVQEGQALHQLPRDLPGVGEVEPQAVVGLEEVADAGV